MARTGDERAHTGRLEQQYRDRLCEVFLEIEREVLGSDHGATSWTDRAEAERIAGLLGMGAGTEALELGAGSGWPGIHLAARLGCDVTLVDLPREGLRIARRRVAREGLGGRCRGAVADGARLPFASARFDAVYHCDVLC